MLSEVWGLWILKGVRIKVFIKEMEIFQISGIRLLVVVMWLSTDSFRVSSALFTNSLHKWLGSHFLTHLLFSFLSPFSVCRLYSLDRIGISRGKKALKQPNPPMSIGPGHYRVTCRPSSGRSYLRNLAQSKPAPAGLPIVVMLAWRTLCREASVLSGICTETFLPKLHWFETGCSGE